MWPRRGNLHQFSADLPGGLRRQDDPLPRWIGRVEPAAPFQGFQVTEDFAPLEEDEDATDDDQELTVRLPAAVIEWLELKSEDLELTVDEVVTLAIELQMPVGARIP